MKRRTKAQKLIDCLLKIFFSVSLVVGLFWLSLGSEFTLTYNKDKAVDFISKGQSVCGFGLW